MTGVSGRALSVEDMREILAISARAGPLSWSVAFEAPKGLYNAGIRLDVASKATDQERTSIPAALAGAKTIKTPLIASRPIHRKEVGRFLAEFLRFEVQPVAQSFEELRP